MEEQNQNLQQEGFNENAIIKGTAELRNKPLEAALQAFVVSHVIKYFTVAAVRALINVDANDEIWKIRQIIEDSLSKDKHVVGFFSCGTCIETKTKEKEKRESVPGISFWVIFDWPEYGIKAYENHLRKLMINTNMNVFACRAIHGRSKLTFILSIYSLYSVQTLESFYVEKEKILL